MKQLLHITLIIFACSLIIGCSTSRKSVQTSSEQHITTSSNENRHIEKQTGEAVNFNQSTNSFANAVIEFTKTEYFDGTAKVDSTVNKNDNLTSRPHDREVKDPPNNGRVKSVTTGRIDLSSGKAETANTDIIKGSETKADECVRENSTEDNTSDIQTEERPKRGFIYYLSVIISGIITVISVIFIVYGIRKCRRKK